MKREDLIKLGVAEDLIDKIMAENGKDIEKHKTAATTAQTELDGLKKQLTDANTAIEGFKKLDVDGIKAAADEWKAKAEQAQAEATAQVAKLKFDHALDGALSGAKARNATTVKALLKLDDLKLAEDGSIIGLDDQLKKVKDANDYLFESDKPAPQVVAGASNQSVNGDSFLAAALRGGGFKE